MSKFDPDNYSSDGFDPSLYGVTRTGYDEQVARSMPTFDGRILQRRVLKLCKDRNLATARAERQMGMPNGTLTKLDKNVPSVARLFVLSVFFEVSCDYLIGLSNRKLSNKFPKMYELWEKLCDDQQTYVMGFMQGLIKNEQSDMKDEIRPETFLQKQRRVITRQIDELKAELKALEKVRKKREYS